MIEHIKKERDTEGGQHAPYYVEFRQLGSEEIIAVFEPQHYTQEGHFNFKTYEYIQMENVTMKEAKHILFIISNIYKDGLEIFED